MTKCKIKVYHNLKILEYRCYNTTGKRLAAETYENYNDISNLLDYFRFIIIDPMDDDQPQKTSLLA
jgi:hypothetical protein